MRVSISYLYQNVYDHAPKTSWFGSDGVVTKILKSLKLESTMRKTIMAVLEKVLDCRKKAFYMMPVENHLLGVKISF